MPFRNPRASMQYFIFVYGLLIVKLLGEGALNSFTKTWGIGLGIDNATSFQARTHASQPPPPPPSPPPWAAATDAYQDQAEGDWDGAFTSQAPWTHLQEAANEALKAAVIALLLEPFLIPPGAWFDQHLDFCSVQSTMFVGVPMTWYQRMSRHLRCAQPRCPCTPCNAAPRGTASLIPERGAPG